MRRVDWSRARHVLTVVDHGGTSRVLVDVSPSLTVRFTPPVDGGAPVATPLYYADNTAMTYADSTAMEYAA